MHTRYYLRSLNNAFVLARQAVGWLVLVLGFMLSTAMPALSQCFTRRDFGMSLYPFSVAIGDFNGDGKPDLVSAFRDGGYVSVLLGNGTGDFGSPTAFGTAGNPVTVAIGDFNADGKPDLVTTNYGLTVSLLLGNGDGSFGFATLFGAGNYPFSVAIGDMNADGKPDLVTANKNGDNVSVLLGNGSGSFSPAINVAVGIHPVSMAIGDLNADGKSDLVTANFLDHNLSVLLGIPHPSVSISPLSQTVTQGQPAQFTATTNQPDLTYQWQLNTGTGFVNLTNDATYAGVNSATLTISNTTTALTGYHYQLIVTSGSCSATSTTATLTVRPQPQPDLTAIVYVSPTLVNGQANISLVVNLFELNGIPTNQPITLRISHDPLLSLSLPSSATSVGGRPVNNSVWRLTEPSNGQYTLTTQASVSPSGTLSVGLTGTLVPNATTCTLSLTASVLMEGEVRVTNNVMAQKIDYFP